MKRRVVVYQRIVPHYRVGFFRALAARFSGLGVEMTLCYGQHQAGHVPQGERLDEAWARQSKNTYWRFFGVDLVWQKPALTSLRTADVVVIEQANRLLLNYLLLLLRPVFGYKLVFWGHGKNFQATGKPKIRERLKQMLLKRADHFLAYAESSASAIAGTVSAARITVLNNTFDSSDLRLRFTRESEAASQQLRASLGLAKAARVGLFCGGFNARKELPFLLRALPEIKQRVPEFEFIFIGGGPMQGLVQAFCAQHSWAHYPGEILGASRADYFHLSDVLLMPGTLGLVVIDSFVCETPVLSTRIETHSPEFCYLDNGQNARISDFEIADYVAVVCEVLEDPEQLKHLQAGCARAAKIYSLDNMVEHFVAGVQTCWQA